MRLITVICANIHRAKISSLATRWNPNGNYIWVKKSVIHIQHRYVRTQHNAITLTLCELFYSLLYNRRIPCLIRVSNTIAQMEKWNSWNHTLTLRVDNNFNLFLEGDITTTILMHCHIRNEKFFVANEIYSILISKHYQYSNTKVKLFIDYW